MIHYHGTPCGGKREDAAGFLMGRHALVPYARPDDLAIVGAACQSFILDNSAYTYWKQGGSVDVGAYRQWVLSMAGHPGLDWCLIPDTIDGSQEENENLVVLWLRMGCSVKSVPVWHMHESLGWLNHLVEKFQTVALGSSGQWAKPGTSKWWDRMSEAMAVACDAAGRPRAKLHGLRMLNPEIFTRLPLASADSTNATQNNGSVGRFGSYVPPTARQRAEVIAARIEIHNSAPIWCGRGVQENIFAPLATQEPSHEP